VKNIEEFRVTTRKRDRSDAHNATANFQRDNRRLFNSAHSDLLTQRTTDHPHTHAWPEPARLRQLNQAVAFARADLSDDDIRNARWQQTIHDEANHTRRPPRVPPTTNYPHKQIAREQRWRDRDLAAMAAALLAQQRLIDVVAGQRETVRCQAF